MLVSVHLPKGITINYPNMHLSLRYQGVPHPSSLHLLSLSHVSQALHLDHVKPLITLLPGEYSSQIFVTSRGETGLVTTVMVG